VQVKSDNTYIYTHHTRDVYLDIEDKTTCTTCTSCTNSSSFSHDSSTLRITRNGFVINLVNNLILSIFEYRFVHKKVYNGMMGEVDLLQKHPRRNVTQRYA